jgi:hypothetical protein
MLVYTQDLEFSIGTEDSCDWATMLNAQVIICTPPVLLKLLLFPRGNREHRDWMLEDIGAIILDELPHSMLLFPDIMPILLLIATDKKWQRLVLASTLSDNLKDTLLSLDKSFCFLEPLGSIFMGFSRTQATQTCDTFPSLGVPISPSLLLALCAGSQSIRKMIPNWLHFNVPQWNWNAATVTHHLVVSCELLKQLGLVGPNDFSLTDAGKIAFSLVEEGDICLFAGYIFHEFGKDIHKAIKSPQDFFYMCSHFVRKRALNDSCHTDNNLDDTSLPVSKNIQNLISNAITKANAKLGSTKWLPSSKITSLYITFPHIKPFLPLPANIPDTFTESEIKWLVGHFIKKMKVFQQQAKLPFGTQTLKYMKKSLSAK